MSSDIEKIIKNLTDEDKHEQDPPFKFLDYMQTYLENEKVIIYVYVVIHHYAGQNSDLDRVFYDKEDAESFVKRNFPALTCIEYGENKISFFDAKLPPCEWITITKEKLQF